MAPLTDYYEEAASSDNRKHSAKRLYHAVRKCDSLKAPAIFFDWVDCNFYVDNDENEGVVDWKSFEQLVDAVNYLTLKQLPKRQRNLHPLDARVSAAAGETTTPPHVDSQQKSHLKESFIVEPAEATGAAFKKTVPVPTKIFNSQASLPTSSLVTSMVEQEVGVAGKGEEEACWTEKYQLLKAFQAEYGTCDCYAIGKYSSEKYKDLYKWALYWHNQIEMSLKRLPGDDPRGDYAAQAKVKLLLDLGLGAENASSQTPSSSKQPPASSSSTKRSAEQASLPLPRSPKRLKTPVATVYPTTEEAVVEVKVEVVDSNYESSDDGSDTEKEDSSDDSDAESASKASHSSSRRVSLTSYASSRKESSIALCSSTGPSHSSDASLLQVKRMVPRLSFDMRAAQWLEYKSKHDGAEASHDTSIARWARKIRIKRDELKAGTKTNLTQAQVDKLTEWGFKWNSSNTKKRSIKMEPKSWETRFEELCQYKEKYRHCVVPQQYPVLGQWVKKQRRDYTLLQDGNPLSRGVTLSEERIAKLKGIGFMFLTRKRPRKVVASAEEAHKKPYDYQGWKV